jgi:ketosteroid isomerase-like protein
MNHASCVFRSCLAAVTLSLSAAACVTPPDRPADESAGSNSDRTTAEVEAAVWAFHAADTARDADAVLGLLWPDYTMFVDGARLGYDDVAAASRTFMATVTRFDTKWTDLRITPLGRDAAVASFQFRDSIVTQSGDLRRSQGTTTFVWQRRGGEWRLVFADADHRPVAP